MTVDREMGASMSNGPVPYVAAEHHEYLVRIRDAVKQILAEMDPTDPLYVRAIERLFIAETMISNHVLKKLLK